MSRSDSTIFHRLTHDKKVIPGITEHRNTADQLIFRRKKKKNPNVADLVSDVTQWREIHSMDKSFLYIWKPA